MPIQSIAEQISAAEQQVAGGGGPEIGQLQQRIGFLEDGRGQRDDTIRRVRMFWAGFSGRGGDDPGDQDFIDATNELQQQINILRQNPRATAEREVNERPTTAFIRRLEQANPELLKSERLTQLVNAGQGGNQDALAQLNEAVGFEEAQGRFLAERQTARERFQTTSLEQQGRAFELAQPLIEQQLNRLGILQSGAVGGVGERTLRELELGRQQQLAGFEQGAMQEASQIPLSGLEALLGLGRFQTQQRLSERLTQQQLNAMLRMAQIQAGGAQSAAQTEAFGDIFSAGIQTLPMLFGSPTPV